MEHVTGHWLLDLQQAQTLKSLPKSSQRHLCDCCKVQLLWLHHQSHTHWIKTSHLQLGKQDSADSTVCTVAVNKTYNFRASYQDQMSLSRDLQKASAIKRRDEKNYYTPPIDVNWSQLKSPCTVCKSYSHNSFWACVFLLPLVSVFVWKWQQLWGCTCAEAPKHRRDTLTQAGVVLHHLVPLPSGLSHDHRPPKWNNHIPVPSTPSTSFLLWVRFESSVSLYPELLYCSMYHFPWTASPLNLVLRPSQLLH